MELQDIEKKYGFEYPKLYKQLYLDGMLDMGEYGPNWYFEVYPKLKENPPLLLHTYDFKLMSLKLVDDEIKELGDPENYRKINKEFRFIPFGRSYGGDHYCFFPNEENNGNVPIVFVWHDLNEVDYLAKNLQDFIFKALLTDMVYIDEDVSDEEFRYNLEMAFKSHKKYLTEQQKDLLLNILNLEIKDYEIIYPDSKENARGLLTYEEKDKILVEIIPFDKMDTSFEYSTK
ncbi:SMI1/KNR4 family protein [Flavobacterium sp. KACC 22763]|uniref:SMI1/KNR4 family protein n=1 Tax=Flavobacterium sp. KACC 22763 TaxID=3025668 RepID=UPI0023667262|nr:SMI1/KNR4 family protein [Flavobacterium sp. KACC 22763]WDF62842.1 SMI1/KNR4 family protein [Flavobacterium sp. KACC 22763]